MSSQTNANAYLRTQVMTASPEKLRMMLLDGALRFATQGRDALAAQDYEGTHDGFSKCRNILLELITTLRPEIDAELCERVAGLYTFMYTQLVESSHERDVSKADKVIELLEYECETWAMLMEQLDKERQAGETARAAARASQDDTPPPSDRQSISFQG